MYITTMEKVYSNTSKVMVDVEGGNNMMYLPLDKIIQQQNNSSSSRPQTVTSQPATSINSSVSSSSGRTDRYDNGRN